VSPTPRLLLPAEHEMFDAACYYERQAPCLGADFLTKIETALQDIATAPERWPIMRDNIRRRLIRRFPYSLLYRVDPQEIIILAVMHQKRHPSYWSVAKDVLEVAITAEDCRKASATHCPTSAAPNRSTWSRPLQTAYCTLKH